MVLKRQIVKVGHTANVKSVIVAGVLKQSQNILIHRQPSREMLKGEMVKVTIKNDRLFQEVVEFDYTPTTAELYYWYSGTHAGIDRNNPYARRYGMTVTRHRYVLADLPRPAKQGDKT
jgi:hypothetical protein